MEQTKHTKSMCTIGLLSFIAVLVCILSLLTFERDINLREYHALSDNTTFISQFISQNDEDLNLSMHSHEIHPINNKKHAPYFDLFYQNKHIINSSINKEDIENIHKMWWNYDLFPMEPFTECEEKYLGYKQNSVIKPGDLTFSNPNSLKILCANDDIDDVRHSHIECYDTKFKGSSYICSFKNIYGYIDNDDHLKFTSFCNNIRNKNILERIKTTYKKSENNGFPLFINIADDSKNMHLKSIPDAQYFDMNNVWFYDNDLQCESHKNGDAEHVGNPWHCFGHLEYWYRISKIKNISAADYNTTLVMSQLTDHKFGPNVPIYHFYAPLFGNIINADSIKSVLNHNGAADKGTFYYIKELFIDERSAKGWGAATIWQDLPYKGCNNIPVKRSHIYYDLRREMMNYYEVTDEYRKYDWVKEIRNIKNINAWNIYGDLDGIADKNESKLIVVATRYLNGRCRYRCVANMKEIARILNSTLDESYVVIYGNPGALTFHAQYHLFKNTRVFIGVHGAVFLMASLFMAPDNLKFELLMANKGKNAPNSRKVVQFFATDGKVPYGNFLCRQCDPRTGRKPSNINVESVINKLNESMLSLYNMTLGDI